MFFKFFFFFKKSFNPAKCKTLLKLTTSRIKLLKNKREIQIKQMKRELAKLLETNQEPSAHIRVELIYRELNIMAAYNIIELLCDLLVSRLPIIISQKQCPIDLREAVGSIIYAAPRCSDIPELQKIRSLFTAKYGKEFTAIAAELRQDCGVNRVVVEKLSTKGPSAEVRLKLMKEIAIEQGLNWSPKALESQDVTAPEDLLDGPSQFFSASQTSMQKSFKESSSAEPVSPQKESIVSEAKTHVVQSTEFTNGKQFIPFIRPMVEDDRASSGCPTNSRTVPMQRQSGSPSYSTQGVSATYSSHRLSTTLSHKYEDDVDSQSSLERRTSFKGVANAALAAAESAEQAAAAARAAAQLASRTFERRIEETTSSDSESDDSDVESQLHERSEDEHLRVPPDDSLTSRMPLFDEPVEERGFQRMDSSGKAPLSYDKSREDPTIFSRDSYNFDKTAESPLHATSSQERHIYDQASRQRQTSSSSFVSNLHDGHDYTRGRRFQSAGAAPSFDTNEWDEHLRAKPAEETPQSGPPTRPPPRPLSGAHMLTKSTSFVHPKLPDYDNLTAHFQALKAMKSEK